MAKVLTDISFWMTSANTEFDEERMFVRYRVTDGDLSKQGRWTVSGLDMSQPISGLWDEMTAIIASIEDLDTEE